ncbi:CapA family protein [Nocardioides sp.]|uniref:CapA family protein n=1 Tax=Nocardioides sp. TaxID=35761 RepID=UPI002D0EE5E5|nr:CapA family protein [Nocardioides sp.]HXH77635.1 CapA family protein [Nocardioides sp.]
MRARGPARVRRIAALSAAVLALGACTSTGGGDESKSSSPGEPATSPQSPGEITIAFAGDVHFEAHLARLLRRPKGALGPMAATLRDADLAMLNLESAITERGRRTPKEREGAGNRYHFRTSERALDVLADAGVDVVSMANNHVADYGRVGLSDTLTAARDAPVEVVGIGRDIEQAFAPYRVRVGGLDVAVLAADTAFREGRSDVWAAGPDNAGSAAARESRPTALLDAVRAAAEADDLVVVYLHWGREYQSCPTQQQRTLSRLLAEAGADVVLGSHAHVVSGSGWSGETYVSYGLGNFVWYHDRSPDTGVLTLRMDVDGVVDDAWTPAVIAPDGRPRPVVGAERDVALAAWQDLQRCTGLGADRGQGQTVDPAYTSSIGPIGTALAARMATSHRPGCPVPLRDLRYLQMTYRDFDGQARAGEMVVHRRYARGVTRAFARLYAAGWPIARMRLVDDYSGDDDRSMAANNTSGFNCRRVAGQRRWSAHAYGAAIDINPVQNPYVRAGSVEPANGRPNARLGRDPTSPVPPGVIRSGELPVVALARLGWRWGGEWVTSQDYQHIAARDFRRLVAR